MQCHMRNRTHACVRSSAHHSPSLLRVCTHAHAHVHVCVYKQRIHACHMRRRIHACVRISIEAQAQRGPDAPRVCVCVCVRACVRTCADRQTQKVRQQSSVRLDQIRLEQSSVRLDQVREATDVSLIYFFVQSTMNRQVFIQSSVNRCIVETVSI